MGGGWDGGAGRGGAGRGWAGRGGAGRGGVVAQDDEFFGSDEAVAKALKKSASGSDKEDLAGRVRSKEAYMLVYTRCAGTLARAQVYMRDVHACACVRVRACACVCVRLFRFDVKCASYSAKPRRPPVRG